MTCPPNLNRTIKNTLSHVSIFTFWNPVKEEDFAFDAPAVHQKQEGGPWNLQMFRSITSDSCTFDNERRKHLHRKGGRIVENTIANCMVQQIRNCKRYIYIENQYFLGSAFSWCSDRSTKSNHTVPLEITKKICEKIETGEPFKVYIVIPMFPEGDPTSMASQEILFWQLQDHDNNVQASYCSINQRG